MLKRYFAPLCVLIYDVGCRASNDLLLQLMPQYLEQLKVAQLFKKFPGMELEGLSP
jgi:hypothetical protein